MARDPGTPHASEAADEQVMAAIDTDGSVPRLVIADISTDGTWLSVPAAAAAELADWR